VLGLVGELLKNVDPRLKREEIGQFETTGNKTKGAIREAKHADENVR